jgi:hypothetical protein
MNRIELRARRASVILSLEEPWSLFHKALGFSLTLPGTGGSRVNGTVIFAGKFQNFDLKNKAAPRFCYGMDAAVPKAVKGTAVRRKCQRSVL